jgi:lipopolysaccharide/colanic/teichoic acid biosynthesis glycosyltransferase
MLKRLFDVLVSLTGILILMPILMGVAICIKLDSAGPMLFKQTRIGQLGHEFKIYKFRTMVVDAERVGQQITIGYDRRITKVGWWLRKFKLDELPQLFNVLQGDMSLVGPRPEVPRYVDIYTPEQRQVLQVRPGITDPASIAFRNESDLLGQASDPETFYIQEIMPKKLELNLSYLKSQSLISDIQIIFSTLFKVVRD